jgi:hypothetical protein
VLVLIFSKKSAVSRDHPAFEENGEGEEQAVIHRGPDIEGESSR